MTLLKASAGLGLALFALAACEPMAQMTGGGGSGGGLSSGGSGTDLTPFQGRAVEGSAGPISGLGFEKTRDSGGVAYWYNSMTAACARMETGDGVYQSVVMVPHGEC
ncbi:hypothetical protein [Poseidonocella sp. HB161398]|uniref:hypothetical protein n=1 Tax=Poseidonocella sp. HB161398 TaxID=2320855 RepID=UPI001107B872|nr:hypothetical protein [Poseidonocella sp. HB161398]